jgi:hypothetical protein
MLTLQDAIARFHERAGAAGGATSTLRLQGLAEYCVEQLAAYGLEGAEIDVTIPGGGRPKTWDVAWRHHGKYRLVISLKSILKNLGGTVPNRIDDMMGEVANVQMYSPEIVVGYLMIFNTAEDAVSKKHGITWCDTLDQALRRLSGRSAPSWSVGMVESYVIVRVDFSGGPLVLTPEAEVQRMIGTLVSEVKKRNPSIP